MCVWVAWYCLGTEQPGSSPRTGSQTLQGAARTTLQYHQAASRSWREVEEECDCLGKQLLSQEDSWEHEERHA